MTFGPRFTLRTLAIFVTLVCAYLAAWEATRRYGLPERFSTHELCHLTYYDPFRPGIVYEPTALMPFVVRYTEFGVHNRYDQNGDRYYLWFFGSKIKLPFESTWDG